MKLRRFLRAYARFSIRVLRVATLCLVLLCVALGVTAHRAVARVKSELMGLGDHLLVFADADRKPGVRHVVINEQSLRFAVITTKASVDDVLNHYEGWCMERDGRFAEQLDAIQANMPATTRVESSRWDATLREQAGDKGYVACLNTGGRKLSPTEVAERFAVYANSGNLADIGQFYYLFAERGLASTRIVSIWIDGDFYLEQMFPDQGDAPGQDAPGIPRPPTGRRMLSARQDGDPYSWTIYLDGTDGPKELSAYYQQALAASGWTVASTEESAPGVHSLFVKRGDELAVVAMMLDDKGKSVVAIATADPEELQ